MSNLDSILEAEQCVLGCIIIDPACINKVFVLIDETDFCDPNHKDIMEALAVNIAEHERTDFIMLRDQLEKSKKLVQVGGVEYLVKLGEIVPHTVGVKGYCGIVRKASLSRRTALLGRKLTNLALDPSEAPEDALSSLIRDAEALLAGAKIEDDTKIGDDIIQNEMSLYDGSFIKPISTTFWKLDDKIVGLAKGEMTLVGARPGKGKTAFAENISTGMAEHGIKVGFLSAEMKKQSLYERMIASRSKTCSMIAKGYAMEKIPIETQDQIAARDELRDRRLEAARQIKDRIAPNMWIDDTPGMDIRHIERLLAQPDKRVDVLFVDHLHHISRSEDKADIDIVVKTLYDLGRRYGHHTVLLAQLNRASANETRLPRLSDLKGSGVIEQVANNVFLIDRPDEDDGTAKIIVSKARDGSTGICNIFWNGESTRFSDVPEQ